MNNQLNFKIKLLPSLFSAAAFTVLLACNTTPKNADTKLVAEEHNDAKFNEAKNEKEAQLLVNAAEINLEEIKLSQLATKNSRNKEVINLAQMLAIEHTTANKELTELAKKKMITLPTAATTATLNSYDVLAKKAGSDFDKAYCNVLVNGHKNAITILEKAASDATDADIKKWATTMLPSLRGHLDRAITCQANCDKMK
jgi:putative membrane protein